MALLTPTLADHAALRYWAERAVRAQLAKKDPELPPDVAAALAHLGWLKRARKAKTLPANALTADEAEGLAILKELEEKLRGSLVRCPHCGQPTEKKFSACSACGRLLRGKK